MPISKPTDISELQDRAEEVAVLLKSLSHPYRLLIACALMDGEKCVSDIASETGIAQPHLSRDLARLRALGLIVGRKESTNVFYQIADPRLATLINALCDTFKPVSGAIDNKRRKKKKAKIS